MSGSGSHIIYYVGDNLMCLVLALLWYHIRYVQRLWFVVVFWEVAFSAILDRHDFRPMMNGGAQALG